MILHGHSQPYLYENNNQVNLLCCYAKACIQDKFGKNSYTIKPWKIHRIKDIKNNTKSDRLNLPNYIKDYGKVLVECNPCVYKDNNIITYTCGFKKHELSAVVYYVVMAELKNNTITNFTVLHRAFNGVLHNSLLYCVSSNTKNIDIIDLSKNTTVKTDVFAEDAFESIVRISKVFDADKFVITIGGKNGDRSILVNDKLEYLRPITDNNTDLYKCSIFKNYLAYTVKDDDSRLENRSIKILQH